MNMKSFGLKFIDIMIGIVLGLGFQWWPNLQEPWQYIAFIFVYLSVIDYWIDTSAAFKKYPPKRELDVILDIAIIFILFLYIYSTQRSITYLLSTFVVFRILDSLWILRKVKEYQLNTLDKHIFSTWFRFNTVEIVGALLLLGLNIFNPLPYLALLLIFIALRVGSRILSSFRYKRVYFA